MDDRQSPYDRFGKELLEAGLSGTGHLETQAEVSSAAQQIDVTFDPDPQKAEARLALGLLGRMADAPCLFELYHQPPSLLRALGCVRKQLTLHHRRVVRALREKGAPPRRQPFLWLVSAGRPGRAVFELGLEPLASWPPGCYGAAESWRVRLLVVSELPRSRDTLLVRLLGAGAVLRQAVRELMELPEDAPERGLAIPVILGVRLTIAEHPELRSPEEEEVVVAYREVYEAWRQRVQQEGLVQGLEQGLVQGLEQGLVQGLEQGLVQGLEQGRAQGLRLAVLSIFESRFGEVPSEVRTAVEAMSDVARLATWSTAVATRGRDEVVRLVLSRGSA